MEGSTVLPSSVATASPPKPALSIRISPSVSTTFPVPYPPLLHTDPLPSSTAFYENSSQLTSSSYDKMPTKAHMDPPPRSLALLADVCSNSNVRWDRNKQFHYIEDDVDMPLQSSSRIVALPINPPSEQPVSIIPPDVVAIHEPSPSKWKEEEKISSPAQSPSFFPIDFIPSSPTAFSHSSPGPGLSCGYSSASERSMTLPISSPDRPFFKKVSSELPGMPSQAIFGSSPLFPQRDLLRRDAGETVDVKASSQCSKSPSPSHSTSPLPAMPSHLDLSPLSSLVSSPFPEALEPPSAISSHFSIASSALSSRSPSPEPDSMNFDAYISSRGRARRASTNAIASRPEHKTGIETSSRFHRSDTAPPETTPRKRKRDSSPSSPSRQPLRVSKTTVSSRVTSKSKRMEVLEENSTSAANVKPTSQPNKLRTGLHAKRPGKRGRKSEESFECNPEISDFVKMSLSELNELPMTGFLVETLALSRASAMATQELLRAVLKSQPHLKEERPEAVWSAAVRCILERVDMFGRIERRATDTADRHPDDQWFYIPENDKEEGRAELLKGLMPKKRAVTKSAKQYYFEPISKHSHWDPGDS